ncbi:MAG TPA: tetratricopeptide repeat protein [Anaeromyxobacteraceae bacterium]|nr:tetratricopeptide repeat protein [Anaeromyxobacteraceae bacterium]
MPNLAQRLGKFPLVALAALAACGGAADPRLPIRDDAAPALSTLASPAGPGSALLRAGDLAGARAAYEAELQADPSRLAALNDLAVSYYLDGHLDAARRLLDEVVATGGAREQQAALVNLGELYAVEGYREAAQAYLETARGIDQSRPEPLYALALLADARGDVAGARAALRDAVRLDDGAARGAFAFAFPEERRHLDALLAEHAGWKRQADGLWRELSGGRFPALGAAASRHLAEP